MKHSVNRFLSVFMVTSMIIVMTVACSSGNKEESNETEPAETKVVDVEPEPSEEFEAESENVQAEASDEMTDAQKSAEAEREAINEYADEESEIIDDRYTLGLSEEKMQELYDAVKNSVTEGYLAKYNISPNDFDWPENKGGQGVPKPWMYLQKKVGSKILILDSPEAPSEDPAKYDMTDPQMVELMDCVYGAIINWIQTNNYNAFPPVVLWHEIIIPNVTFE